MAITPVPDRSITRQVSGRLARRGLTSPCRVTVDTVKGEVTLSGTVAYAHQKAAAVQATNGIAGIRRVVDRLIVKVAGQLK